MSAANPCSTPSTFSKKLAAYPAAFSLSGVFCFAALSMMYFAPLRASASKQYREDIFCTDFGGSERWVLYSDDTK